MRRRSSRRVVGLQVGLMIAALALAACSGGAATPGSPAPSPTMRGEAGASPEATRPALPAIVLEVARAVRDRNGGQLLGLLGGEPRACGKTPSPGIGAGSSPTCAPGTQAGTLTGRYIIIGNCEGFDVPAGPSVVDRLTAFRDEGAELHAVVRTRESFGSPAVVYLLVFRLESAVGRAIMVKEGGIAGVYYGCGSSPEGLVSNWVGNGDAVVYPAADLPR